MAVYLALNRISAEHRPWSWFRSTNSIKSSWLWRLNRLSEAIKGDRFQYGAVINSLPGKSAASAEL